MVVIMRSKNIHARNKVKHTPQAIHEPTVRPLSPAKRSKEGNVPEIKPIKSQIAVVS